MTKEGSDKTWEGLFSLFYLGCALTGDQLGRSGECYYYWESNLLLIPQKTRSLRILSYNLATQEAKIGRIMV
jgi:hypothetical protein